MDLNGIGAVLDGVVLPMVLIGGDDRILAANAPGKAILGDGQIGRDHAIALRQPALLAAIDAARHQGAAGQARYVILGSSHEVTYDVTVTPLGIDGGDGALCAFQDITEQEMIGQFRSDFVADVSHELRTPLTSLIGAIETLQGAARDDPAARARFLASMEREARRMARLVHDLLALSQVEAQERQRPAAPVRIGDVVCAAAASLRTVADAANVTLETIGVDGAPTIPGDADQLLQVVQNLIENAVKYAPDGQRVTITIHSGGPDDMLRIEVIDRGAGIAPRHLPRLTERFYRADTHRARDQGGTGLGLAIVKHILGRHRGRLTISSRPGEGSCFSVHLPRG